MDPFTIVFPILLAACSFVLWTIFSTIRRYKIARLQADIQAKLVDKFGTTQDLIAYTGTETGREFLRSLSGVWRRALSRQGRSRYPRRPPDPMGRLCEHRGYRNGSHVVDPGPAGVACMVARRPSTLRAFPL